MLCTQWRHEYHPANSCLGNSALTWLLWYFLGIFYMIFYHVKTVKYVPWGRGSGMLRILWIVSWIDRMGNIDCKDTGWTDRQSKKLPNSLFGLYTQKRKRRTTRVDFPGDWSSSQQHPQPVHQGATLASFLGAPHRRHWQIEVRAFSSWRLLEYGVLCTWLEVASLRHSAGEVHGVMYSRSAVERH